MSCAAPTAALSRERAAGDRARPLEGRSSCTITSGHAELTRRSMSCRQSAIGTYFSPESWVTNAPRHPVRFRGTGSTSQPKLVRLLMRRICEVPWLPSENIGSGSGPKRRRGRHVQFAGEGAMQPCVIYR
eukprot:1203039-Prymnesium_polylepis.1